MATQVAGLSLKKNFSWTFLGNLGMVLSQFGMLVVLARFGGPEMTGQYGLGLAITAPLYLLASMSLRNVQVTDHEEMYPFAIYVITCALGAVAAIAVLVVIVVLFSYSRTTAEVILLIGAVKSVDTASDLIFGVFQKNERMDLVSRSMLVKAAASLVVFSIVLYGTGSLVASVLSILLVGTLRLVTFDIPNFQRLTGRKIDPSELRMMFRTRTGESFSKIRNDIWSLVVWSMPLAISAAVVSLNTNVPRYVLEHSAGTEQLGIYTVLAYPLAAGSIVVSALSQSALPRLSKYRATGDMLHFLELLKKLMIIALVMAIAALVAAAAIGVEAVGLLFGSQYASHRVTLLLLVVSMGVGFVNWFLNSGLVALRQFGDMAKLHIYTLAFTVACSLIIIPFAGIEGAAFVALFGMAVQTVLKGAVVIMRIREADTLGREG